MNDEENLKRFLSIDFGLKRIGLALSDPLLIFAYPFKTIFNDQELWNNLSSVIKEKNIEKIILGYPLKSDGSKSTVTENVLKFKKELEKKFNIEVILRDESFSSSMAKEKIIESVNKKSKRRDKGLIDRNSAAIILQEYLDEIK